MADIKLKESKKGTIKTLNKSVVGVQKLKENVLGMKNNINENTSKDNISGTNYAIDKISNTAKETPHRIKQINRYGKNNFYQTVDNVSKVKQKAKYMKRRNHAKKIAKNMIENSKKTKNAVKTAEKTGKQTIKTAEKTGKNIQKGTKATIKITQKAIQITKRAIQTSVKTVKATIKATIAAIKTIIAGIKGLIALIVAGGWVVIVIVLVICMIAMICSSIFGIFFSSETTSTVTVDGVEQTVSMSSVISDLNTEFINKITTIQNDNEHDDYEISGSRAEWKDVLAVYCAKVSNGNDETELMTLDESKIETLKTVFWDMNEVTSKVESEEKEIDTTDEDGYTKTEKQTRKVLYIIINSKSVDEMITQYSFNTNQKNQIAELQSDDYLSLWSNVIYGSSVGSSDIVTVAKSQIGNTGGQIFWSWYGFSSRVEWCAIFVSWCANECGYIDAGIIPKFASCESEGVTWFKTCGLWKERGYIPKTRRYNIF